MAEKKVRHNNTSRETRDRWDSENLTRYNIYLHNEKDADIISAIEKLKADKKRTTDCFRILIRGE